MREECDRIFGMLASDNLYVFISREEDGRLMTELLN